MPLWFEAVCENEPNAPFRQFAKPRKIDLPDNTLREIVLRHHPELNTPVRVHNTLSNYVPIVDRWVTKQLELEQKGMPRNEAFALMEREHQEYRYRRLVERLVLLSDVRREQGLATRDELPPLEDNTNEVYEERVDKTEVELERRNQLEKFELVREELDERRAELGVTRLTETEMREELRLEPEERATFVRANPEYKDFFADEVDLAGLGSIDPEHPIFRDLNYDDVDSVDRAVLRYADAELPLKLASVGERHEVMTLSELTNELDANEEPFELEGELLRSIAGEHDDELADRLSPEVRLALFVFHLFEPAPPPPPGRRAVQDARQQDVDRGARGESLQSDAHVWRFDVGQGVWRRRARHRCVFSCCVDLPKRRPHKPLDAGTEVVDPFKIDLFKTFGIDVTTMSPEDMARKMQQLQAEVPAEARAEEELVEKVKSVVEAARKNIRAKTASSRVKKDSDNDDM